jgi:GT2 family glycosyltransferase
MTAQIRIIITAYNSQAHLPGCLAALTRQDFQDFEVIIVDNGGANGRASEDGPLVGTHDIALPDARFSHRISPVNDGFSGGFVRGAKGAQTPWLMSLNPDCYLDPDCLSQLLRAAESAGRPAMVSPILFSDAGKTRLDGLGDSLSIWGIPWRNGYGKTVDEIPDGTVSEVFAPTGAAALYRRDAYEAAGGFDPRFFCYLEDIDLAIRLRAHDSQGGGRCLLVHTAKGYHSGGHSTEGVPGFALEYTARNAPLFILGSLPAPLRWLVWPLYKIGQASLQRRARRSDLPSDQAAADVRDRGYDAAKALRDAARQKRRERPAFPLGANIRLARRLDWGLDGLRHHRVRSWPWVPRARQ